MTLIRGISALTTAHRPSVVSIGNYDGVHLGHQHVIKTLLQKSAELDAPSTVITFEPLAKEFFNPQQVTRLGSVEQRASQLFEIGVDQVLCIDFTAEFAAYSPIGFVQDVLINGLGVKYLCVGDDFRFGKDRAGDFEFLKQVGAEHNFTVTAHDTYQLDNQRVSSGRVRQALQAGDFDLTRALLGRDYSIQGIISKGQQLGRTLNYPTANIVLGDCLWPINGVFAVTAKLENGELIKGVANIGKRPTVDGKENRLEVHLFDFDADIYGQPLEVMFHHKIRDEQKFDSIEQLRAQIEQDAASARQFLLKY